MDSISENVVAMIAVVVGILIIGTALVPIVQHASSGTETTEIETGSNNYDSGDIVNYAVKSADTITYSLDSSGLKANGQSIDGSTGTTVMAAGSPLADINSIKIKVYASPTVELRSGTLTVTHSGVTATGITADSTEVSTELSGTNIMIIGPAETMPFADPTEMIANLSSPAKIGQGQTLAYTIYGDDISEGTITTETASVDGLSLTHNADGTVTVAWDENDVSVEGPIGWAQAVTTSEGSSQYAALYGIIPIMCILAMAYVLIRRF